jgi:hypothetical protein
MNYGVLFFLSSAVLLKVYNAECDNMDIRRFLWEKGPSLSSTIKNELLKEGLKDEAARQQISRARGGIYRLKGIQFPKREQFIYLKDQEQDQTKLFYTNLINAFNITSSVHKCIIAGLNNYGGCVHLDKLRVLSGCPKSRKKKKNFDQVVRELQKIGLIDIDNEFCYLQEDAFSSNKTYTESRVIIYLNEYLREILALWLRKNNFVSYDAVSFNGDFCSYYWDIFAPSYLLPFMKKREGGQSLGFVVADIIPQYDIGDNDVDYFIRKVESCFVGKNTIPFIPILLGYGFENSTWKLLKSRNILVATVNNFFGEETEKLLTNIAKLLETKNIKETDNLDDISNILKAVSKIEGQTNNLRGHFFELIVGFIMSRKYTGSVILNKKISKEGEKAEVDVMVTTTNEIILHECKGKKTNQLITGDDIEKWAKNAAFIYKYFKSNPENANRHIIFNFWTTSDFSDDANAEFEKIKATRYTMKRKNGKEVFDFSKKLNLEAICGILKEYFLR